MLYYVRYVFWVGLSVLREEVARNNWMDNSNEAVWENDQSWFD